MFRRLALSTFIAALVIVALFFSRDWLHDVVWGLPGWVLYAALGAWLLVLVLVWTLCAAAARGDRQMASRRVDADERKAQNDLYGGGGFR